MRRQHAKSSATLPSRAASSHLSSPSPHTKYDSQGGIRGPQETIFVSRQTCIRVDGVLKGGCAGRPVGSQLSFHHRCPVQSAIRLERDGCCLSANPLSPMPIHSKPSPFRRSRDRAIFTLREPHNLAFRDIRGDAREAMGQSPPSPHTHRHSSWGCAKTITRSDPSFTYWQGIYHYGPSSEVGLSVDENSVTG